MTNALNQYLRAITPAQPDLAVIRSHREFVEATLKNSSLNVSSFWESGSVAHGTGIAQHSDVDYLVSLVGTKPQLPSSMLTSVKSVLAGAGYPIRDVAVSSPVVRVRFYSGPDFEIAPGYFTTTRTSTGGDRFNVYDIGGRRDEWVQSSPLAHNKYVTSVNTALGSKVKPLVRLVKAWKYSHDVPVSSFYLEMRTAEYAADEKTIFYDLDLRYALKQMLRLEVRDMNDPLRVAGRIPACASDAKAASTRQALRDAISALDAAEAARAKGDWIAYWLAMSDVFDDFPLVYG